MSVFLTVEQVLDKMKTSRGIDSIEALEAQISSNSAQESSIQAKLTEDLIALRTEYNEAVARRDSHSDGSEGCVAVDRCGGGTQATSSTGLSGASCTSKAVLSAIKRVLAAGKALYGQHYFNTYTNDRTSKALYDPHYVNTYTNDRTATNAALSGDRNIEGDGNWQLNDPTRSDCFDVVGAYPSVLEQDLGSYRDPLDRYKPRELLIAAARYVHDKGGVFSMCYHMNARYSNDCYFKPEYTSDLHLMYNIANGKNEFGEVTWFHEQLEKAAELIIELNIPVILRPFHEMNGNWFWWGNGTYTDGESYVKLYRAAVTFLRERVNRGGKDLLSFCWSPNFSPNFSADLQKYYPGDDFVDIVGLDVYDVDEADKPTIQEFKGCISELRKFSNERGKVSAITEIGNRVNNKWCLFGPERSEPNFGWITEMVRHVFDEQKETGGTGLAYIVSWCGPEFMPHQHSSDEAKDSFRTLKDDKRVLFLDSFRLDLESNSSI